MLIKYVTTDTGRKGIEITADGFGTRTLLRKKVTLGERKAFFGELEKVQTLVVKAQGENDEEAAIENSITLITLMLEGLTREDFDKFDVFDVRELAEAMPVLMGADDKATKKNG